MTAKIRTPSSQDKAPCVRYFICMSKPPAVILLFDMFCAHRKACCRQGFGREDVPASKITVCAVVCGRVQSRDVVCMRGWVGGWSGRPIQTKEQDSNR